MYVQVMAGGVQGWEGRLVGVLMKSPVPMKRPLACSLGQALIRGNMGIVVCRVGGWRVDENERTEHREGEG